jgi:indole-3-glycerol phosphate synthase/phosphoribosylanthranilate isomerase
VADILERIVAERRLDLEKLGPAFGFSVPRRRERPLVPFLAEPGAILEIKRASPSKGDIAPDLDPAALASAYAAAGARNVSVLTERRYFKGGLEDLAAAAAARPELAYLRKDFLLADEEIDVSFRAGADAVLLIARILDETRLRRMAALCRSFGMTPFVEVREAADYDKLRAAASDGPLLSGVNARDLATFSIDPLIPAVARSRLPGRAVYESGIDSSGAAAYARRLGFEGILVGEAAAKAPARAAEVVGGFLDARQDAAGIFWRQIAERRESKNGVSGAPRRPLVKICGLARQEDALRAAELGADLLGFVFAESPRAADEAMVRSVRRGVDAPERPFLVGVVTELESSRARTALALAGEGVLDAVQWHGEASLEALAALDRALEGKAGRYAAVRVGGSADLEAADRLRRSGEPRILADARVEGAAGGTGTAVPAELAASLAARGFLWLAGGLGVGTVGPALRAYAPELVDASSRLESEKGKKDRGLLAAYFKEIEEYAR